MTDEEPNPWITLSSETTMSNPWFKVLRDEVRIHDGTDITYEHIDKPPAAFIVPVTDDREILLIRQYRYPVKNWCWEVPAGASDPGEGIEAATRELREEIGGIARDIRKVGWFFGSNAFTNELFNVYLATGVELSAPTEREATELIRVVPTPSAEAVRMARAGEISDGPSALAILMCEPYL